MNSSENRRRRGRKRELEIKEDESLGLYFTFTIIILLAIYFYFLLFGENSLSALIKAEARRDNLIREYNELQIENQKLQKRYFENFHQNNYMSDDNKSGKNK
jgi:predicted membrane protein